MPRSPQLVDLDRLHHVTPGSPLLLVGLDTQSGARWASFSKCRSLAKGESFDGAQRQRNNTARCSKASQLFLSAPVPRRIETSRHPEGAICLGLDQRCGLGVRIINQSPLPRELMGLWRTWSNPRKHSGFSSYPCQMEILALPRFSKSGKPRQ